MDQICEITPLFIDFFGIYQLRHMLTPFLPSQFAPLNPLLHLSKAVMKKLMVLLITLVLTQIALMLVSQSIFFFHTQPSTFTHRLPPPVQAIFSLLPASSSLRTPTFPFSLLVFHLSPLSLCRSPNTLSLSPDNRSLGSIKAHQLSKTPY